MFNVKGRLFSPTRLLMLAGVIVLVMAVYAWWRLVYSSPTQVFNRMLNTTLSTASLSKRVVQSDASQQLDQQTQVVTEPVQRVHSVSTLKQGNNGATVVVTESIGSPSVDFVRYNSIKTDQKTASGKDFNFAGVLGVWGKADSNDPESGGAQLFNQTVLGVVPSANLAAPVRKALIKQEIDSQVYKIDYSKVGRQVVSGRPVYTYDVTVQPVAYVTMLKAFARSIGLTQLEQVDPTQYKSSEELKFGLTVDVWSGQLRKVTYKDSERAETYSSYGARLNIVLPKDSIAVQDLQARLQQIR